MNKKQQECQICGKSNWYEICVDCCGKGAAHNVFYVAFMELLKINDIPESQFPADKKYLRIQNVKSKVKAQITRQTDVFTNIEKQLFHQAYALESYKLENNETYAFKVLRFDPVNKNFIDKNSTNWFVNLKTNNIRMFCGLCKEYPCRKVKAKNPNIVEIKNCKTEKEKKCV